MPDLTELRRLLKQGSPQPWKAGSGAGWGARLAQANGYTLAELEFRHDADLIVAAVNALPDLLDAAEALAAEPTEAEVEAAAAAIYAELSGRYGDFNWPGDAARAALKWAAAARR